MKIIEQLTPVIRDGIQGKEGLPFPLNDKNESFS